MSSSGASRIDWVDAGRGIAIVLVVLFHATNWLGEAKVDVDGWRLFNETVASMRLPLFFTMAGLFAQKWVAATWASLWRSKLSLFVWVYAVWSVIATFSFMLGLNLQGAQGNYWSQLQNLAWAPFLPRFELWFIWALALFFVIARLMRRLPMAVQLIATGALASVALSGAFEGNVGWVGIAKYFFFFVAGLLLREHILRWSARTPTIWLGAVFVAWAAMACAGSLLSWSGIPGYYFVSCVLGVAAGVALSRVLATIPGPRYLGSRTLPIYLTHTTVILIIVWMVWRFVPALPSLEVGWWLTPTIASVAVFASLGTSALARSAGPLRYLYEQPRWFARANRGR